MKTLVMNRKYLLLILVTVLIPFGTQSSYGQTITASVDTPLAEATLDGSVVTLMLSGRVYERSIFDIRDGVTVSGIEGVTYHWFDLDRVSDTVVTVGLQFIGDFDTDGTLTFTVGADAIADYNGSVLTAQVLVTAVQESVVASTAVLVTEATLDGSVVTLTLSSRVYERFRFRIRDGITVSGIEGVTYHWFDLDRVSDTVVTVGLQFIGDFDTDAMLTFTVGADAIADYNGVALTAQVPVTTSSSSNNAPTFSEGSRTTRTVVENMVAGIDIGSAVSATDADNDSLTYSLGGTDALSFRINSTSGQLRTHAALDYETKRTYTVTVTVSDGSLTASITVTITVTDVPETPTNRAPVFTAGSNTTRTVVENTIAGVNIGSAVSATDADNDALTYMLGGTDALSFRINNTSGQLRTDAALDYEIKHTYTVMVTVSDGSLTASITVTITVTDVSEAPTNRVQGTPVSERTRQVRDAIIAAVGVNSANDVTEAHLAAITSLSLMRRSITALKAGDFDGLTSLTALDLNSNQFTTLPADTFDGLTSLTTLNLCGNVLTTLPADIFDGLTSLTTLNLCGNGLTTLPADIFDGLTSLTTLNLDGNALTTLLAGIFDGLTSLTTLNLDGNALTTLPADIFDGLTSLTTLNLGGNALTTLLVGIFDGLTSLTTLNLGENALTTLLVGIFDGLTSLTTLNLGENALTTLPVDIFDGLTSLTTLFLHENALTTLLAGIFDGLTSLDNLDLVNNPLSTLPSGIFSGLSLGQLNLSFTPSSNLFNTGGNSFNLFPQGIFSGLGSLGGSNFGFNFAFAKGTAGQEGVGSVPDPLLTLSLEQVGEGQFKATAPSGAPFDIVLPLNVTNGTINGGATTITIPQGSEESEPLTVTPTPGTTDAVTVDIGTLPGLPTDHSGYVLVKSEDLPLIFNVVSTPSETTLMAIKGTVTTEDGTPAEAGLEVTVTIGSTTQTAVSEAGGVYSAIFTTFGAVVATSGDTVTVQVLNPNTGATTERTVQLSSEQIAAKQATIDLQFSPSGREYLLSVPEGISLIHVPLKVTAVGGVAQTLESVGDLYDALGGAATVSLLITHDPKAERWVGYFGSGDRGSSADKVLTDDLGIIAVMTTPASVQLSGDALGTNGSSSITLYPGINLVGVPLKDSRITRVTDLFALEGIKDNVSLTLVSDNGEIKLTESAGDSGDIPVTGGQSFILVAKSAATVEISGTGWSNVPDPAVAPSTALTGIEVRDTTPVLAMSGSILPPVGGASLPRLGVPDFSVTVKNLSTGTVDTAMTDDDGVTYQFTFVDIETGRAAQVGDILEITAQSPDPFVGVQPLRYVVTVEDVKRSRIPLAELVAYEIPAKTGLLLNYPNPFNPETWIPYRLAKDAFVTVTIYDLSGRMVRDIAVGHRIAAVYESRSEAIYWDGRTEFGERVASGIYFYTLTAGDYTATRKMVILK